MKYHVRRALGLEPKAPAFVLGCGPAGLFAATALSQSGYVVRIFSKPRKSELFGTQYLHAPIPELTDLQEPIRVSYRLNGTPEGYREKIYGINQVQTSVQTLERDHQAWDIRRAYDVAWAGWKNFVEEAQSIDGEQLSSIIAQFPKSPIVSSIPAPAICLKPDTHRFEAVEVWAAGDAPERDRWCPIDVAGENEILCDGTRDVGWYRTSKVFGYRSVEWPVRGEKRPPISGLSLINKPLRTDCDCFSNRVLKVGRYGTWTKGVLSHTAYTQAAQI